MKILIFNGNPDELDVQFDSGITQFANQLSDAGHSTEIVNLREKNIRPCTGCFKCWIKTPGTCVIKDDAIELSGKFIHSDHVVLASPLKMGYFSAIMKNTLDRSIPNLHPHLEEVNGEIHHKKRYDTYPGIGVLLKREESTDQEDIDIITDLCTRMCINIRTSLSFVHFIEDSLQEAVNAVNIH